MCSRMPRAVGDVVAPPWLFVLFAIVLMTPTASAVVPPAPTVDAFDLASLQATTVSEPDADAAAAQTPAVAPLPPALASGLLGLTAMAVLRVGRRVYRRR